MRLKDLNKDFRLFLFLSVLFALASFSYSFLLIYARDSGYSESSVPVLYLVFTAFAFLGSIPFGKLSDRIGRKKVMLLAYLFWMAVCLLVLIKPSQIFTSLVFVLYGLHRGALETVQRAFVAELCPPEFRASSLGGYQMIIGLCALPGSLLAGLLWEQVGIYAPFYLSLALTAAAVILLSFVREK
jgi:MFS family permease